MHNRLSIVIPCFNEPEAIPLVERRLGEFANSLEFGRHFRELELLVVDDGSDAETQTALESFTSARVIRNAQRLGYGGALKTGFQNATGDVIAFLDMDCSYDPMDLFLLLEKMQETKAKVAFGSRMVESNEMPALRWFGNYTYQKVMSSFFRCNLSDVCTGMRLFDRSLVPLALAINEMGLDFSIALTAQIVKTKTAYCETPITYSERAGRSKLNIMYDGFTFFRSIFRNRAAINLH